LQSFPGGYEFYTIVEGEVQEYADGTMHVTAQVESIELPGSGWFIDVWFYNGMDWDSWSTQSFPTSYKCDFNNCGDQYLDWTYYLLDGDQATLLGYGAFDGTLTLDHAPSNLFYGYQVGVGANNVNENYGGGGWFYYGGSYSIDGSDLIDVSGAGDFAFDRDCCPDYSVVRTWCVEDCSGNSTCTSQTITFEDLDGVGPGSPGAEPTEIELVKGDFGITAVKPNPAVDYATVEFLSNTNNTLTLEVYDLAGRKVATLFQGNVERDVLYRTDLNTSALESGIYNIRLFSLSYQVNEKLVVSK
ncbi:MAG: T9SS type A sorting domain-containing protein, partial [Flavobacteriales bacterium]|nr:T9SS type A sorting domain-containing protein [Flavobacteriales bacterium]